MVSAIIAVVSMFGAQIEANCYDAGDIGTETGLVCSHEVAYYIDAPADEATREEMVENMVPAADIADFFAVHGDAQ